MPLQTIALAPGTNKEITVTQGMAQITSSQLIRFKMAGQLVLAEKLGGWDLFYPVGLGSAVRALHAWEGINSDKHLAAGCLTSLNVITDGSGSDITPQTTTTNDTPSFTTTMGDTLVTIDDVNITTSAFDTIFIEVPVAIGGIVLYGAYDIVSVLDADTYTINAADPATSADGPGGDVPEFTTTNASAFINVALVNHGFSVGEVFPVISTTVGGLTLSGGYLVQAVVDADNFTIIATSPATSGATASENGGDVRITYYIGLGPSPAAAGYGAGGYGAGGYGIGAVTPATPGTPITATNWTLDNWGEVLIACPSNGPIYAWSPDSGFPIATRVLNAPIRNGGIFVSNTTQILVAWGSSFNTVDDPLQINWSDVSDYTNWTVSSQTQAGGYRIPTGSRIVGGLAGPNFNIIWTDLDVWAMDYVQPPEVYGFNSLASNCGLIGRHAMCVMNSTVYWMGSGNFYVLEGENVQIIPCTVWDVVYQDLDIANADKITCASNTLFNEIAWYYPSLSGGTGEIDSYVKFNVQLGCWDYGTLSRTAWTDQSVLGNPIGGTADGLLYQHETSPDANGQPLNSWFESGYFEIADGENLSFVDWIIPDFKYADYQNPPAAIVQITLYFADYPNVAEKTRGPYATSSATPYVNTRLRARLARFRVESNDLGSFWRYGGLKIRAAPDGKR